MKKIIFALALFMMCTIVNAENIKTEIDEKGNYINSQGVIIDRENYDKLKNAMSEIEIQNLSQESYKVIEEGEKVVAYKSVIIETTYKKVGSEKLILSEKELTLKEYATKSLKNYSDYDTTEYKAFELMVTDKGNKSYSVYFQNNWKKNS